jgi:hypothetical protein
MKHRHVSAASLVLFIAAILLFAVANAFTATEDLHVLVLEGSPCDRGLKHGKMLRAEILHLVDAWKADLKRSYGMKPDELIELFLAETDFIPAIERWTPGLMDEVRGIAEGSGVDFKTIFAYQLPDEMWANAGEIVRNRCTSIGIDAKDGRPALAAQNLDIPGWYHLHPTVLHIKHDDSDLESFVVTVPGLVGANGLNNRSVAVCVNTLLQLKPSRKGLPVAFVVRGILAQKTHAAALQFVRKIEHASGQNYIVAGPEEAPSLECSMQVVEPYIPFEGAGWTYHTNHPLANRNYRPAHLKRLKEAGPYRCDRLETLEKLLKSDSKIDLDLIKKVLGTRNAGVPINNPSTYVCTIMVLTEKPELHISPGRPDAFPFEILHF